MMRGLIAILVLLLPAFADAQQNEAAGITLLARETVTPVSIRPLEFGGKRPTGAAPWWTPLASAIVPGAGQARLRQDRFVGYLAVEAYAMLQYVTDTREAARRRGEYRDLARRVARSVFSENRPDGDFAYYETMSKYIESGVYDLVPGGELEPEFDPDTYNGQQWLLARRTFWPNPELPQDPYSPEYVASLNFYRARAITPEYRWSWRNAQLQQDLFRRTIGLSNDAVRRATTDLGVILANHALSMVDAYVSVRLRNRPAAGGMGIEAKVPWPNRER